MPADFAKIGRPSFVPKPTEPSFTAHVSKAVRWGKMLDEAGELAQILPKQDGEALHAIMLKSYDLTAIIKVILNANGRCRHLRLSTLAFSVRNASQLDEMMDQTERLTLLYSTFHRNNNPRECEAMKAVADRHGERFRMAASRTHAKIALLDFRQKQLTMESSANLRTNGSNEQIAITQDSGLHDFYATWIDRMVRDNEGDETGSPRKD